MIKIVLAKDSIIYSSRCDRPIKKFYGEQMERKNIIKGMRCAGLKGRINNGNQANSILYAAFPR
jgi:hypothetical protein